MILSNFAKAARIGFFALALSLMPFAGVAQAQVTDTGVGTTRVNDDRGMSWGWIGLFGLLGLGGLMGRKRDDNVHTDRVDRV